MEKISAKRSLSVGFILCSIHTQAHTATHSASHNTQSLLQGQACEIRTANKLWLLTIRSLSHPANYIHNKFIYMLEVRWLMNKSFNDILGVLNEIDFLHTTSRDYEMTQCST